MQSDIVPSARTETKTTGGQPTSSARPEARQPRVIGLSSIQPGHDLPATSGGSTASGGGRGHKLKKWRFWAGWSRRKKIVVGGLSVVLVLGLGAIGYALFFHKDSPKPQSVVIKKVEPPKPTTVASPLTGVQVAPELAARPVTAVMIENSIDARPQSGLQDAGLVFEAIAEGGITRFMALFQEGTPQYIGPVRSLRPYYIDFAAPFQAGIAHVGGSPDALTEIRGGGARDLDQFANAGAYWRSASRRAPHNMYTSFERLDALNKQKGFTESKFDPWPRKEEQKLPTPTAKTIDISISSALYNVHYDYEAASNTYIRGIGGKPHVSTVSESDGAGYHLRPKVVIALILPYSLSGKYSVYGMTGSGVAYIFQDGGVIDARWSKASRNNQFVFTNIDGTPLKLNSGQTWVSAISGLNQLKYVP